MFNKFIYKYLNTANIKNALLHLRTFGIRSMVKKTINYLEFTHNYDLWYKTHTISSHTILEQQKTRMLYQPLISIIVPVYNTPDTFLCQMIESILNQTYSNWELCIADGSPIPESLCIQQIISLYQKQTNKIFYKKLTENLGISGNTNAALNMAHGEYIALLDHDDLLTADALFEVVSALNSNPNIDVIYTDEDKIDINSRNHFDPYFKPDFNLDLLRSCNYITHFYVVRKSLASMAGGFSIECNGSQDYDFILKTCELATNIHHIPKVLYHWRIHPDSVAGDPESKSYAYDSAVRALQNHLKRCGENATVNRAKHFGYYETYYHYEGNPRISIWLNDCDPNLKSQINSITTYKNYDFITTPSEITGQYVVYLFQVTKILTPDWLEKLLGNCSRSNVGIVGTRILHQKNRIFEYGLVYSNDGIIHSPFNNYHISDTGYCYRAQVQQNCSIIGPYCFMLKTSYFQKYYNIFLSLTPENTIYSICKQLTNSNLSIVLLPNVQILCNPTSRKIIYSELFKGQNDPNYNPNFSTSRIYHLNSR